MKKRTPAKKEIYLQQAEWYDNFNYNKNREIEQNVKREILRQMLKNEKFMKTNKPLKILDLASAETFCTSLFDLNKDKYYAVDVSTKQLAKAKKKGCITVVANLSQKFPFENDTFDIVIATEILEHILDTDFFLQEIRRVLKKGGIAYFTTPNSVCLKSRFDVIFGRTSTNIDYRVDDKSPGHIRSFDKYRLRQLFKDNDLKIEKMIGLDLSRVLGKILNVMTKVSYFQGLCGTHIIKARK